MTQLLTRRFSQHNSFPIRVACPAARRRAPLSKSRSIGYIPCPPNAFILFRANFMRQKHVPGLIETNHGSLSKIIGEYLPTTDQEFNQLLNQAF